MAQRPPAPPAPRGRAASTPSLKAHATIADLAGEPLPRRESCPAPQSADNPDSYTSGHPLEQGISTIAEHDEADLSASDDEEPKVSFATARPLAAPVRVNLIHTYPPAAHFVPGARHASSPPDQHSESTAPRSRMPFRKIEQVLGVEVSPIERPEAAYSLHPESAYRFHPGVGRLTQDAHVEAAPSPAEASQAHLSSDFPLGSSTTTINLANPSYLPSFNRGRSAKRVGYELPHISIDSPTSNYSRPIGIPTPFPPAVLLRSRSGASSSIPAHHHHHQLTLYLHSHNHRPAQEARVIVPGGGGLSAGFHSTTPTEQDSVHNIPVPDDDDPFDDEQLFRAIRLQYQLLRGGWLRQRLSFRRLARLRPFFMHALEGHTDLALPAAAGGSTPLHFLSPHAPHSTPPPLFSERQLWESYQHPHLGRKRYDWVQWIRHAGAGAGESAGTGESVSRLEHRADAADDAAAIEFVHGWNAYKISAASGLVVVLGVAAAVLWIVLGADPNGRRAGVWSGAAAAARVPAGLMAAGVTLLLGWGAIAVWAVVDWLLV
ncbi:MAG: hypothetical protein M1826_007594 [Phylliscum demangeonii]|nr:MAG: hypothetical protein M1826_007594 [Phylliscum demangeonii]